MSDRELLELAAKAAGYEIEWVRNSGCYYRCEEDIGREEFNPLDDDGDALRLAVHLRIDIYPWIHDSTEDASVMVRTPSGRRLTEFKADNKGCKYAATRRTITRAAAEIGRAMK